MSLNDKEGKTCLNCGVLNPSKFWIGGQWRCFDCRSKHNASATDNWCPATGKKVHSFSDFGTWVDHRHPVCCYCDYVDMSRDLDA